MSKPALVLTACLALAALSAVSACTSDFDCSGTMYCIPNAQGARSCQSASSVGGLCDSDIHCSGSNNYCVTNAQGAKACAAAAPVGGVCNSNAHCAYTTQSGGMTYCNVAQGQTTGTCATASSSAGSSCSESLSSQDMNGAGFSRQCQPASLYCGSNSQCTALQSNGASCTNHAQCTGYCTPGTNRVCASFIATGSSCTYDSSQFEGCGGETPPYTLGYCVGQSSSSGSATTYQCSNTSAFVQALANLLGLYIGLAVGGVVLFIVLPIVMCICCAGGLCCAAAAASKETSMQSQQVPQQQMMVQQPVTLPPGWIIQTDPATGKQFYANPTTNQTSWTPPVA